MTEYKSPTISNKEIKAAYVAFVEACVRAGVDITELIFNRPAMYEMNLEYIIRTTQEHASEGDPETMKIWEEDNAELMQTLNKYKELNPNV